MLGYPGLEDIIGLSLEYTEGRKVGWRPVFLIKARKVKALMMSERLISDDLHSKVDIGYFRGY
jgi:hypothetical protein